MKSLFELQLIHRSSLTRLCLLASRQTLQDSLLPGQEMKNANHSQRHDLEQRDWPHTCKLSACERDSLSSSFHLFSQHITNCSFNVVWMNKLIKKFQRDWLFWRSFSLKKATKHSSSFGMNSQSPVIQTYFIQRAWKLVSYKMHGY